MNTDTKKFWDDHAATVGSDDPLRQVLRVQERRSISELQFSQVVDRVVFLLEVESDHSVLDLCCGNGLLTAEIEPYCSTVVGVDYCERLLRDVRLRTSEKTTTVVSDVRDLTLPESAYDRVLLAAALQHFEFREVIDLFQRVKGALRPGGVFVVTDVPERARMWTFFNSPQRESECFDAEVEGRPILGTWFERAWLEKLATHVGFEWSRAESQPSDLVYSHYRFDFRCAK